jgi:hypothetical protein
MRCVGLLLLFALTGCFCEQDPELCPEPTPELPQRLSETDLFDDVVTETLGPGVREYAPQFELESDGAEKRRWFRLPEGAQIDTTNAELWQFPVGTTFWKEFTKDGVRVETRVLSRVSGDEFFGGWSAQAYVWNDDDAIASPEGLENASGTTHDVPTAGQCIGCHNGTASRVLGFSAVQLAFDSELIDLDDLRNEGALSNDVDVTFPGDDLDHRALGYLHANCAHCHNQQRPEGVEGFRCFDPQNPIDMVLATSLASVDDSPLIRDFGDTPFMQGQFGGEPALLILLREKEMPALGSEQVDEEGVALLAEWLERFR